jgi:uncharacterized protein
VNYCNDRSPIEEDVPAGVPPGELRAVAVRLSEWASRVPSISRVWIFGSRIKGTHRHDSDLDVAIEIDRNPAENLVTSWFFNSKEWEPQIEALIPWELDLQWYDLGGETPHVVEYVDEQSVLVYVRR